MLSRLVAALAEALDGLLRPVRVTAEATEAARAADEPPSAAVTAGTSRAASIVPQAPGRMAAGT